MAGPGEISGAGGGAGEIEMGSNRGSNRSWSSVSLRRRSLRSEEEDFSDDDPRMPLRGSQNGNWWYAVYHNVTAIVGSGVLGLPLVMVYLGWYAGSIMLVMSWTITLFTVWQMIQMYEFEDENGKIIVSKTYYELGQYAFGDSLGLWLVLPQQLIVFLGVDIVYMVTGGQSLCLFYLIISGKYTSPEPNQAQDQCCGSESLGLATFIVIFGVPQLIFTQLDGFNAIAFFSLASSIMAIGYCFIIAWAVALPDGLDYHDGHSPTGKVNYHFPKGTASNGAFHVFSAIGVVAFAYGGHNVVLEIQQTLPSSKDSPSKIRMWRGVLLAYIVVAICYFPVAIIGYWAFGSELALLGGFRGNPSDGNILRQLPVLRHGARGWVAAASLMVVVHVTGSYLIYAMPTFDVMEKLLVERFQFTDLLQDIMDKFHFQPSTPSGTKTVMRAVTRSTYVVCTIFIACTFPFFGDLLSAFGGLAIAPTTYFMPCIIWLQLRKPKRFSLDWLRNWFCIFAGVLITIVGTIGGIRNLIVDAEKKRYHFYQFTCK